MPSEGGLTAQLRKLKERQDIVERALSATIEEVHDFRVALRRYVRGHMARVVAACVKHEDLVDLRSRVTRIELILRHHFGDP